MEQELNGLSEIWKDIKGYEGFYQVSNLGRIKALERKRLYRGIEGTITEKLLSVTATSWRYYSANLKKPNEKQKRFMVHRLIAEAFIPNPYNKPFINHIDGDKLNNNISNLEWCTASENMQHSVQVLGNATGEQNGSAILDEKQVIKIKQRLKKGDLIRVIAKDYDVAKSTISMISCGKNWSHVQI